jgi:hypothetical protein
MPKVVNVQQYHDAAHALNHVTGVRAADVIDRDPELDRPTIKVHLEPGYERVPARVHGVIRDYEFGTRPDHSGVQGQPRHFVLVVT